MLMGYKATRCTRRHCTLLTDLTILKFNHCLTRHRQQT